MDASWDAGSAFKETKKKRPSTFTARLFAFPSTIYRFCTRNSGPLVVYRLRQAYRNLCIHFKKALTWRGGALLKTSFQNPHFRWPRVFCLEPDPRFFRVQVVWLSILFLKFIIQLLFWRGTWVPLLYTILFFGRYCLGGSPVKILRIFIGGVVAGR